MNSLSTLLSRLYDVAATQKCTSSRSDPAELSEDDVEDDDGLPLPDRRTMSRTASFRPWRHQPCRRPYFVRQRRAALLYRCKVRRRSPATVDDLADVLCKFVEHDLWIIPGVGGSHLEACCCESFRSASICQDDCQLPKRWYGHHFACNGKMSSKFCNATQILHRFAFIDFWKPLIQSAATCGKRVFEYAYDFTRPMPDMGLTFAETLLEHHRAYKRPLIIVAHLMGGLVTLEALAAKPELIPTIGGIVCMGSPFHGSADALLRRRSGFKWIVTGTTISEWRSLDALEPMRGNEVWRDAVSQRTQDCCHPLPPVVTVASRQSSTLFCNPYIDGEEPVLIWKPASGDGTVTFESATSLPSPWPEPRVVLTSHHHVGMVNQTEVFVDALGTMASLCKL